MLKKLLTLWAILLGLNSPLFAEEPRTANLNVLYDLDATDLTFCKVTGNGGTVWDTTGTRVQNPIATSGSSTTTSEVTDTDPFTGLDVNDLLYVDKGTGSQNSLLRAIAVKTSVSSVVVSSAWNLDSGYPFTWFDQSCGTGATDGWVDVSGAKRVTLTFAVSQLNVTGGIDVQMQCRGRGLDPQANQVFPACASGACNTFQNYTTAGIASTTTLDFETPFSECRVGIKIGSADDGGDLTTDAERVNITLERQ